MPLFNPTIGPLIVADEASSLAANAAATYTANGVYLYAFELQAATTFSGGKWRCGATTTGTTDVGIYSFAGNLQGTDTGAVTNVASTNISANFTGGNITLPPGQYFAALCVSNGTDTIAGKQGGISTTEVASRQRFATNSATSGVLPSTTGGYSDAPVNFPSFALTVVNGLT